MSNKVIMGLSFLAFLFLCWFCLTRHDASTVAGTLPAAGAGAASAALTAPSFNAAVTDGKVVLQGMLPDEATKNSLLVRARELYGEGNFTDNLKVASNIARPGWLASLSGLLPALRLKDRPNGGADLSANVDGTGAVTLSGQVASQDVRAGIVADVTKALPANWKINDAMFVSAGPALAGAALEAQTTVNKEIAGKIIQFDTGKSTIREGASGTLILNQVAEILGKYDFPFEVGGHTDNVGNPAANQRLSQARAEAVKTWLAGKGIAAGRMSAKGYGDKNPVADNSTPEGQQRNRRIEFSIRSSAAANK